MSRRVEVVSALAALVIGVALVLFDYIALVHLQSREVTGSATGVLYGASILCLAGITSGAYLHAERRSTAGFAILTFFVGSFINLVTLSDLLFAPALVPAIVSVGAGVRTIHTQRKCRGNNTVGVK